MIGEGAANLDAIAIDDDAGAHGECKEVDAEEEEDGGHHKRQCELEDVFDVRKPITMPPETANALKIRRNDRYQAFMWYSCRLIADCANCW